MRRSVHELNQIPTEFHEDGAPEFPELPDEFNRFPRPNKPRKRSNLRKILLILATIGVIAIGVLAPNNNSTAEDGKTVESQTPSAPVETAAPDETPAPTPVPTDTPAPTPSPTPEPLTGTIHIVVYSDILDVEAAMAGEPANRVIAEETFDAATFESYTLPELPTRNRYTALGYVLFAENSENYLVDLYFGRTERRAIGSVALSDTVTEQDIRIVPMNGEGVREAEIHTVWLRDNSIFVLEFYDDALFGTYHVGFPMDSDGLLYLAAFPTPVREGYTFAGWCDSDGTPVDTVTYFDFFEPLPDAQTLGDRDWSKDVPYRLYAMWRDGSGELVKPEPQPDCQVVYFFTHSVSHGAVVLSDPSATKAVHVRLRSEQLQDSVIEDDWTAEEIASGRKEYYGIDMNGFYGKHMAEIEALDSFETPVFEATVTYAAEDGEHSVTRRMNPSEEDYLYVNYDDETAEPSEFTFPGCFTAWAYGSPNEDLHITADPDRTLKNGEICVLISVNGETIPDALCRIEKQEDTYEFEGETYTDRSYVFIMQRPDSFPAHGRAHVEIRQQLMHFDYLWIIESDIDY